MCAQRTFEELFASSLAALDQIAAEPSHDYCQMNARNENQNSTSLQSSGSVDDFLVEYQAENSTIVQFMSSLEEPELMSAQATLSSWPLIHARSSQPIQLALPDTTASSPRGSVDHDKPMQSDTDSKKQVISKSFQIKLTAESKAERRREKNREYQRRFREKKLRLEIQRTFMRAPAPVAGCFSFH
jgi:hypothetical protein